MRCLALAQAWQAEGGAVTFITACDSEGLLQRLSSEGFTVVKLDYAYPNPEDWAVTAQVLATYPDAWVVLDGYHFDPAYQRCIKETGHRLLVIDDMAHLDYYHADVILNQNIHAEQLTYPCNPATRLLLGTRYALLRCEFWPWRGWEREIPEVVRKVLVTLGGSDPDNQTLKMVHALQQLSGEDLEVTVVVGGSNPRFGELQSEIHGLPGFQVLHNVSNMPEWMAWADLAITAGGSTCWELAFMGLPSILLVLAENQRRIAEGLNAAGIALNLGGAKVVTSARLISALCGLTADTTKRAEMAQLGQQMVDGMGSKRVIQLMLGDPLILRPVCKADCHRLWEWANDPVTRAQSFTTANIPWEEHQQWFEKALVDPATLFYLAINADNQPIGQIRYQLEDAEAVVSVSVAPEYRGRGYGFHLIHLGTQELWGTTAVNCIHAYIKPENDASLRAFSKAGFIEADTVMLNEQPAHHLVYKR